MSKAERTSHTDAVPANLVPLGLEPAVWERVFTVAPLILVGSREASGETNFAPKHLCTPLSWENHFGFVCTPRHSTYRNIQRTGEFTVTYPRPDQVVLSSLAASGRSDDDTKPVLAALPSRPAVHVDAEFFAHGSLFLECTLDRIVDGFGVNSLIAGRIVAAWSDPAALRTLDRDDADLIREHPLLAYVFPNRFAEIRETYSFPFPADFSR